MRVQCPCGKNLKVADHLAGKKVRCPACSKVFPVEEEEVVNEQDQDEEVVTKVKAPPVKSKVKRRPEPEPEDGELDRPRPKKRRNPNPSFLSRPALLLGIGGGIAVLAVTVVVIVLMRGGGSQDKNGLITQNSKDKSQPDRMEDNSKTKARPDQTKKGPPDQTQDRPPLGKPDFTLTAQAFAEEYGKNRDGFMSKYQGKIIEVNGIVQGASHDIARRAFIFLEADGHPFAVSCYTLDSHPWQKVMPGQTAKLKGVMTDPGRAHLKSCEIVEVSGQPRPPMTADEVAKEFAIDQPAADRKYRNKYLVLTGEFTKLEIDVDHEVWLKTDPAGPRIKVSISSGFEEQARKLQAGQKVKILAGYFKSEKNVLYFESGVLLDNSK